MSDSYSQFVKEYFASDPQTWDLTEFLQAYDGPEIARDVALSQWVKSLEKIRDNAAESGDRIWAARELRHCYKEDKLRVRGLLPGSRRSRALSPQVAESFSEPVTPENDGHAAVSPVHKIRRGSHRDFPKPHNHETHPLPQNNYNGPFYVYGNLVGGYLQNSEVNNKTPNLKRPAPASNPPPCKKRALSTNLNELEVVTDRECFVSVYNAIPAKTKFSTAEILEDLISAQVNSMDHTPHNSFLLGWIIDPADPIVSRALTPLLVQELNSMFPPMPARDPLCEIAIGAFFKRATEAGAATQAQFRKIHQTLHYTDEPYCRDTHFASVYFMTSSQ
ncbi:hypothetical protein RUND412_005344 [Rhizina undulata]